MTLELPARLLADRVTVGLAVASGLAFEGMLARHPGSGSGIGLALGLGLLLWHGWRSRYRPRRVQVSPSGVRLVFESDDQIVPAAGKQARVLGKTVVLHWHGRRGPGPSQGTLWVTPADLPADALRVLRVALVAGSESRQ
jgi:hypothetical protein